MMSVASGSSIEQMGNLEYQQFNKQEAIAITVFTNVPQKQSGASDSKVYSTQPLMNLCKCGMLFKMMPRFGTLPSLVQVYITNALWKT